MVYTNTLFIFQFRWFLVAAAVLVAVSAVCNDFDIQYGCLQNVDGQLNVCKAGCSRVGAALLQCEIDCLQKAYGRLVNCITLE